MIIDELSEDEVLALLDEPTFVHDERNNMPRCSHIQWLEAVTVCDPGSCGSHAYVKVDGKPRCLIHAFTDLIKIIAKAEEGASV